MNGKEKLWNRNFIIACITYFLIACSFNLLMPAIPIFLSEELGVKPSKIGIALSSYAIALLVIRPFCGYWVDVFQRKPLLVLGILLFVGSFVGYYFAFTITFFVILRFFHGLFWGLSTVSANTVAIDIIPSSRRAEGIGYFGVNSNLAMAIAPYIAVNIYDAHGFNALISSALGMGILSIIVVSFINIPIRKKLDKVPPLSFDRFLLIKGIPILLNQLFISFGWGTLIAFAVLYGKQIGIHNSGIFFLFLAGGIVLSRITSGKFVDRGYVHYVMTFALLAITLGFTGFSLLNNIIFYCISAFLIGIGYGTLFPALQTIYINMTSASKRGTANSTYLTGFDLGIGIGMLLGAYIAEQGGYSVMFLVSGGFCLVAVIIYHLNSKKVYDKNRLTKF